MADETNDSNENVEDADTGSIEPVPAVDAPTEETAAADETQPAIATPSAPPPNAPASRNRERSSLTVPTWAAVVAGAVVFLLLLGGSFVLGRETADDDGDTRAITVPAADEIPRVAPGNPDELPPGVARAFFGVSVETADGGVAVRRVSSGSPAEDAGVREGDVITQVDGTEVATPEEFADAIHEHDPGDEVTITYTRDGDTGDTTVRLAARRWRLAPDD